MQKLKAVTKLLYLSLIYGIEVMQGNEALWWFTSGDIIISIKYEGQIYDFRLFVSTNTGKVEAGGLSLEPQYELREPTAIEIMLINEISEVMITYNPG